MNIYAERLRELENALDDATADWLWHPDMLSMPTCRYCGAEGRACIDATDQIETFPHKDTCPRDVLTNDRIGYRR